jgi:L-rhamnose mutarotase
MKRYCFALDLKDDPQLIAEYEARHKDVWPEVIASIKETGIVRMEIYRIQNRLLMIMETTDQFDFEKKAAADQQNKKIRQWEELMWKYQQALPGAQPGEKWMLMEKIFELP